MRERIGRRELLKLLALAPLSLVGAEPRHSGVRSAHAQATAQVPNVIIILFDTLSARHLSLHGYPRATTPHLDRFAEQATVYHAHYATGNFTTPSTASLLTGTYPWSHRAFHHSGIVIEPYESRNLFQLLSDTHHRILYPHNHWADLLLQQFRQKGDVYLDPETYGLTDHMFPDKWFARDAHIAFRAFADLLFRQVSVPGSLYLSLADKARTLAYERLNLPAYEERYPRGIPSLGTYPSFFLLEELIDGLTGLLRDAPQPFVAYLHLFPPHEPYCPRREFVGIFEDGWMPVTKEPHRLSPGIPQSDLNQWRMEYDEYVTHSDAEFGRLRGFLDGSGLMDRSIVILTSDHGQLFERGVHGHDTDLLYEPVIRIPLLISWPGERRRHDILDLTSCVDLIPTLMEAVGKEIPDWCEGNTLPRWDTEHVGHERTIFSVEAKRNPAHGPLHVGTIALLRGHHKLIHYLGRGDPDNTYELYNLADDPEEMENLYADGSSIAAELEGELKEKLSQINRIDTRP